MRYVLLMALLCSTAFANPPVEKEESGMTPVYLPMGLLYVGGIFSRAQQLAQATEDLKQCLGTLGSAVDEINAAGKVPKDSMIVGACMPVPKTVHIGGSDT